MSPQRGSQVTRQVERSLNSWSSCEIRSTSDFAATHHRWTWGNLTGAHRDAGESFVGMGLSKCGHVSRKQRLKPQPKASALTRSREFLLNYCNGNGVSLTSRSAEL